MIGSSVSFMYEIKFADIKNSSSASFAIHTRATENRSTSQVAVGYGRIIYLYKREMNINATSLKQMAKI
ncbi:hypothetical protein R1flu_009817 [Riccia fluitans]|uniref:Uncharacterized protein n=1 Tax=Riccia fluitans TaxID=41844 RepID=A0ABD1Z3Z6_9MARC